MEQPQPPTKRIDFSESYSTELVKGKSALITGGALGIGAGISTGLAEAGAQFIKTDVTSWDQIVAAFEATVAFSPAHTVDIVVPNAGIASASLQWWLSSTVPDESKPESKTPPPPPTKVVDVNFHAVYHTAHAALWYFKNHPGPDGADGYSKNIVFVSSMGGYNPMPGVPCYNSSKWGVRGLFWSLRGTSNVLGEGKPKFRANLIAPTWVRTNMTKGIAEHIKRTGSVVKVAEVEDVVDVVMRMVSDEEVKGRAAAIAADKQSFDLCDDSEGPGVGQTLGDPQYLKRFGYGPLAAEAPKTNGTAPVVPKAENVTSGPVVTADAVST